MSEKPILPGDGPIEAVNLREALEERYLAYALSTIMHRALIMYAHGELSH